MEMKPNYKQTEVGVIPEDWEVRPTNQIGTPVRGGSPRPAGDPKFFNGSYIPWLTVAALTNIPASQLVVSEMATCLTEEGSLRSRTLTAGTLIIANSGATLGVAKILGVKCCANDGIAALFNLSKRVSPEYLAHFINTKTSYLRDTVATGNGQPNLNTELIGNFKIPLPPTKAEQEAIAEALSDADAFIQSLEQLLTKKRQLKEGAMQELLTGKRRLSSFSGEWELRSFGEIAIANKGSQLSSSEMIEHGEFAHLNGGISPSGYTDKSNTPGESIAISEGGNSCGYVQFMFEPYWCGGHCYSVIPNGVDNRFLYHLLKCKESSIMGLRVGSGLPNVQKTALLGLELRFPKANEEQRAIATILSDMDAEIAALDDKLSKAHKLKRGMMQELLTGRIRLV